MWRRFRVALGFLTLLPVAPQDYRPSDLGNSVVCFPVVGLFLGLFTWGLFQGLLPTLEEVP